MRIRPLIAASSVIVAVALALTCAANAFAAPMLELTLGSAEPAESITTQLGAVIHGGNKDYLVIHLLPAGGEECGANPAADHGKDVTEGLISNEVFLEGDPASFSTNWTFTLAGNYKMCGWVSDAHGDVLVAAETTFHARQPHLALSIASPPIVAPNQSFQIVTTAQAETRRSVWEYELPNTGDGCPANAGAAAAAPEARTVLDSWEVTGGPFAETRNEAIKSPGVYLLCAYFEYPSKESPPELSASATTTVTPPCVVPRFAIGAPLKTVEAGVRAAGCTVGPLKYSASNTVHRGDVLALSPKPSSILAPNGLVAIYVSAGRPCVVPSVHAGESTNRVEHMLTSADCRFVVVRKHTHRVRRGEVIGLGSRSNSKLFPLTQVRVIVSTGA